MDRSPLFSALRSARRGRRMSQVALAAASDTGRVTIARLEAGSAQDFRLGTLSRLCEALGLELAALPRGGQNAQETLLAREREHMRRLDLRRRHCALAVRLLAAPAPQPVAMLRQARAAVDRWERERLCSEHYITRWRAILAGPARSVALRLIEHDEWTDALFQNTPWGFALEPAAA